MSLAIPPSLRKKDVGVIQCGEFSAAQCDALISMSNNPINVLKLGRVNTSNEKVVDLKKRDVDVWVIHEDQKFDDMTVDQMLVVLAVYANQTFDFNVTGLLERPQLLRYSEGSKGYDWHLDIGTGDASTRKISLSIILNNDYEGGELAFFSEGSQMMKADSGVAVAFPSFLPHKVMPVTKGERWSLVAWFAGEPFR
jgi:PKHD-type hydroxylase|tara:strand:+ start:1349 stop:1936 length:588 start_codon:yes stop_codon:yes gene_type:complete